MNGTTMQTRHVLVDELRIRYADSGTAEGPRPRQHQRRASRARPRPDHRDQQRGDLAGAAGLRELTPQQRQIRLAATGLSNREIAQRLFLSPRTVSSHLYRSFPKLGVAGRHQLHGLLVEADNRS